MATMTLCPNCKTIQRVGDVCGICTCPIKAPIAETTAEKPKENSTLHAALAVTPRNPVK